MTLPEFLTELSKYKGQFRVLNDNRIRSKMHQCPIEVVFHIRKGALWYQGNVGVRESVAEKIIDAADTKWRARPYRRRLLAALGLEER